MYSITVTVVLRSYSTVQSRLAARIMESWLLGADYRGPSFWARIMERLAFGQFDEHVPWAQKMTVHMLYGAEAGDYGCCRSHQGDDWRIPKRDHVSPGLRHQHEHEHEHEHEYEHGNGIEICTNKPNPGFHPTGNAVRIRASHCLVHQLSSALVRLVGQHSMIVPYCCWRGAAWRGAAGS